MARGGGRGGAAGRAGGGGGGLIAVLDTIDANLVWHWETYKGAIESFWSSFGGNNGQMVIVQHYIVPVVDEYLTQAEENWPYSPGPSEYYDMLWSSYDQDVLDRAFSQSFNDAVYEISEFHNYAVELQVKHDSIMNDAFSGATDPHALQNSWRNG